MRSSQIKRVAATGDVTTGDTYLRAVILTGGSAASTVTVKAGGSSGTTVLELKAGIDTVVASGELADAFCGGGVHATLAGTGAAATFVYA